MAKLIYAVIFLIAQPLVPKSFISYSFVLFFVSYADDDEVKCVVFFSF